MDETKRLIGDLERIQRELDSQSRRINQIELELTRLAKSDNSIMNEVASLLREQAVANIETSKLLTDVANKSAEQAFRIEELESWRSAVSGGDTRNWVASHRANQLRMTYSGIKDGFNENEILELVLDLGIPLNAVNGDGAAEKAMWLVDYARNHQIFWKLVKSCKEKRPLGSWPKETGGLSDVK